MTCKPFGCHSCIDSLRAFILVAEEAEKLHEMKYVELAFKELKSAKQLARVIAYEAENKET